MAIDKDNIVYSLLAATILANLDRSMSEKLVKVKLEGKTSFFFCF